MDPRRPTLPRRPTALAAAGLLALLVGATPGWPGAAPVPAAAAASVESYPRPASGSWVLDGRGYGHGRGMSQWGAQNAARAGVTATTILATYYPGTTLSAGHGGDIRVRVTADDGTLVVPAQMGLRAGSGTTGTALPTTVGGCTPARWRVVVTSGGLQLQASACGTWAAVPVATATGTATAVTGPVAFSTPSGVVRVVLGSGSGEHLRDYRGSLGAVRTSSTSSTTTTVNTVAMDSYLRSVVAWEMSPSWQPEALKAQAVAARTYAAHDRAGASGAWDTCDSTACQAYRGVSDHRLDGTRTTLYEHASTDAAVQATAGQALTWAGKPAFTQFSASNGGRSRAHSSPSAYPYLPERADPWDGLYPSSAHAWTTTVSAAALEKAYPGIGSVTGLRVLARSGAGEWGGWVTSVAVDGTAGSTTTTGETLRSRLGLKSAYVRPQGGTASTPTASPTTSPTASPTTSPTTSPTASPTASPTTSQTTASPSSSPTGTASTVRYTVRAGDTLSSIARAHGTTYQAIMDVNRLTSTTIYVGQVLTVPVGTVATPSPTATVTTAPTPTPTTTTTTTAPAPTSTTTAPAPTTTTAAPAPTSTTTAPAPTPVLSAPAGVRSGSSVTLSVSKVRAGTRVAVHARPYGATSWATVTTVTAAGDGSATASVPVRTTTDVRVVAAGVTSAVRTVKAYVDPVTTVTSPSRGTVRVSVTLRPLLAGVPVSVYRVDADGTRSLVARPTTASGTGVAVATLTRRVSGRTETFVAVPQAGPQRVGRAGAPVSVKVR